MNFSLTDDQVELQFAFSRLFEQHSTIGDVRRSEPCGFSRELWKRLVDLGVPSMTVAPSAGGDPATLSQLMVIAEEYGRRLAPAPLLETLTAARSLERAGVPLPQSGTSAELSLVTLALRPAVAGGALPLLAAGAVATDAVVLVDGELVLADLGPAESLVSNLGSSPLANRTVGAVRTVIASRDSAPEAYARALDDWKILLSAALFGLASEAHRMAVAYVKERKAFGVPIGWFQTVAHRLADSINDLDGARFLTHKGAWAVDAGDENAPRLVSMAYAYSTALAERITAECLHFHGGIGYTMEHDIQLYFRRAKSWPLALGDPRRELSVVGERMFGPRRSS